MNCFLILAHITTEEWECSNRILSIQTGYEYSKHLLEWAEEIMGEGKTVQGIYLYEVGMNGCFLNREAFRLADWIQFFEADDHDPLTHLLVPDDMSWCGCSPVGDLAASCYYSEEEEAE